MIWPKKIKKNWCCFAWIAAQLKAESLVVELKPLLGVSWVVWKNFRWITDCTAEFLNLASREWGKRYTAINDRYFRSIYRESLNVPTRINGCLRLEVLDVVSKDNGKPPLSQRTRCCSFSSSLPILPSGQLQYCSEKFHNAPKNIFLPIYCHHARDVCTRPEDASNFVLCVLLIHQSFIFSLSSKKQFEYHWHHLKVKFMGWVGTHRWGHYTYYSLGRIIRR